MKSIWAIGDTHSTIDGAKLWSWPAESRDEYVIVCGDFGFIWNKEETPNEAKFLDWIESNGATTLAVTGNHDNIPAIRNNYPLVDFCGDKAYQVRPHVFIARYGGYYTIHGKTIFTVGGAHCHDIRDGVYYRDDPKVRENWDAGKRMMRIIGESWWEEEVPNEEERRYICKVMQNNNYEADFIITHQPPASTCRLAGFKPDEDGEWNEYAYFIQMVHEDMSSKKFVSGHMHVDRFINERDYITYNHPICLYREDRE